MKVRKLVVISELVVISVVLFTGIVTSLSYSTQQNTTIDQREITLNQENDQNLTNSITSSTVNSLVTKGKELTNKFKYEDAITHYNKALQ
jgi:hypothetical protein